MKFLLPLLLLLAYVFPAYPQTAATAESSVTEFDVNGLKVIFKRRSSSPTVSAGLFFRGGVRNQTADNAGIENLALAAATESSKKFPRATLRKELARTGTSIGSSAAYDYGVMSLTSTSEYFARSWEVFTDIVLNPTFAADDVDRSRNGILAGLRNASASPDSALDTLEESVVYGGHPYANSPNGTIATVTKLSPENLRAYYKKLLQTSRLLLVVVGDADAADIKKFVTASFGSLPRGDYKDVALPPLNFSKPSLDVTQRALNTNYIKGVFQAPSVTDPDYYAMRVAIAILQSRVYQEVRIKRNLSYAPNAEMGNRVANTAEIYVTAVDANQAVQVMLNEMDGMRKQAIETDEFAGIPGYFLTTYYVDQETNAAQAGELARYELVGGGWRNALKFLDGVRSVTPEQVRTVSQKYFNNLRFVVIGDPKAIDRSIFVPKP